jgi:L-alanine-DL-glutamate epimerase-like enolase superfamily enzyme
MIERRRRDERMPWPFGASAQAAPSACAGRSRALARTGAAYSAGPDEATAATIRDFKEWLVGKDPRNVEYLWATMYNFTRFPGGLVVK